MVATEAIAAITDPTTPQITLTLFMIPSASTDAGGPPDGDGDAVELGDEEDLECHQLTMQIWWDFDLRDFNKCNIVDPKATTGCIVTGESHIIVGSPSMSLKCETLP